MLEMKLNLNKKKLSFDCFSEYSIFANSEDPDEMSHDISSASTLFAKTKPIYEERSTIIFWKYII